MDYRAQALDQLDTVAFFGRYVQKLKKINGNEYGFLCPFHDDREQSANVNLTNTLWFCHACGAKGTAIDLAMKLGHLPYKEALAAVGEAAGMPPPSISRRTNGAAGEARPAKPAPEGPTEEQVAEWHDVALRNTELMTWLREKRGYTQPTIDTFQLGWDGARVTIPIRDAEGHLVNVRRYKRDSSGSAGKMIGYATGLNEARLFPLGALAEAEIVLVEGEWDAILARQYGLNAMTVTSGAGIFNEDWVPLFADKSVVICYDNDDAGRDGGRKVAEKLAANMAVTVSIATIPGLPPKGDVTDFFVEQGRTVDELTSLLLDAVPMIEAPAAERGEPLPVALYDASNAALRGQYLSVPVLVSGKAMTPYTVPADFSAECDMSNKRLCPICPLKQRNGKARVSLDAKDARVLDLINVSTATQEGAMKKLAGVVGNCTRPRLTVHASANIEELRVIPELDTKPNSGEVEHVSRTGYFIGHGLRANLSYEMRGYSHPLPKTQATVHLFSEAIPAQDNISAFTMTDDLAADLAVFRAAEASRVVDKFAAIYDDLRLNVHRIQGRLDMQIAYDLVWHSVIGFNFNGSSVRRGWVETMVIGDSGQGKTEMAMSLLSHYRMGERVQGEQASGAGLIGGLEKMGDTWMLGWGKIPLNDKRLLVIDETQGLQAGQIESMSDVRATGVAEITKIRTERTNARCRIVWLANPVSGKPLAQHNQGVIAVRELFKKPEDVRRLDFAICVASGDVPLSEINAAHGATGQTTYTSDLSRSLILWAWSRRPDQVVFSAEATRRILAAATAMGERYSAGIPLVEPADQRLKLARLAAAAAARVFNADPTGQLLLVEAWHVDFVVEYLERIYSAPGMAYDEFSGQAKQGESLDDDESAAVKAEIDAWEHSDEAVRFFRQAMIFKKSELVDVIGWDDRYAKAQLRYLASNRLIRPTREGFIKTPIFIGVLRSYVLGIDLPSESDAAF